MFFSIDQSGKMPSVWRSPATSATGSVDARVARAPPRRREQLAEHLGLALAAEPGEADDLAAMGDELGAVRLPGRPGAGDRRAVPPLRAPLASRRRRLPGDAAHRRDQAVAGEFVRRALGDHRAVAHHDRPGRRCRGSRRGDARSGCTAPPPATKRRTKPRSWPASTASSDEVGSSRMTSFTGVSVTEKARAISTICRRAMPRSPTTSPAEMPWPGKISSSLSRMSRPERAPPAEASERRRGRRGRSPPPSGSGRATAPGTRSGCRGSAPAPRHSGLVRSSPPTVIVPAVGAERAGEHMHQRRFAGAVVADQAEAFAGVAGEIDTRRARGRRRSSSRRRPGLRSVRQRSWPGDGPPTTQSPGPL